MTCDDGFGMERIWTEADYIVQKCPISLSLALALSLSFSHYVYFFEETAASWNIFFWTHSAAETSVQLNSQKTFRLCNSISSSPSCARMFGKPRDRS